MQINAADGKAEREYMALKEQVEHEVHGETEIELCNAHPGGTDDAQSQMVAEWCAMGVPAQNPEASGASLLVAFRCQCPTRAHDSA